MAARKKKLMKVMWNVLDADGWGLPDDTFYDKFVRDGKLRQHVWVWNEIVWTQWGQCGGSVE